jgi:hypothetical protein
MLAPQPHQAFTGLCHAALAVLHCTSLHCTALHCTALHFNRVTVTVLAVNAMGFAPAGNQQAEVQHSLTARALPVIKVITPEMLLQ